MVLAFFNFPILLFFCSFATLFIFSPFVFPKKFRNFWLVTQFNRLLYVRYNSLSSFS